MENKSSQTIKVPLILVGVAVLVILAGIVVRSRNSPSSPPTAEPEPALVLTPEPAPVPAPSPESTQQIVFSSLAVTDSSGDNWSLGLAGVPPQARDSGTKPGAPLSVKADVQGYGQSISIGLIIEGQAGEVYEPGAAKNGRRRPAPKFEVLDESGTVLGSGSFEYGWGGVCRSSWRAPNDFKGKYRVEVDIDLGPFETKHPEIWQSMSWEQPWTSITE